MLIADWRRWAASAGIALLLIVPWFVYAQVQFGNLLWHTMLGEHVYARFTTGLNPAHVQPWNYYLVTMDAAFTRAGVQWLVLLGVVVLAVQSVRRRAFDAAVVVIWGVLPLTLISLGSSKLYHYAYPFLPPLTLAAGYVVALAVMLVPVPVRRYAQAVEDFVARHAPRLAAAAARPPVQRLGAAVIWGAVALAIGALLFGQVRLSVGHVALLKSSGVYRPILVILAAGVLTRQSARTAFLVVVLAVTTWMPVPLYAEVLRTLRTDKHPLRDASTCIAGIEAGAGALRGLYVDTDSSMWHPIYYYFRRIQPWTRQLEPSPERLERYVHDPAEVRPALVQELRYRDYLSGPVGDRLRQGGSPPMIALLEYALLLPGPYSACSPEASLRRPD